MIAANTSAVQMLNYQPAGKQKGDAKAGGGDFLAMLMNMQSDVGCRLSEAGRQISDIKENSGAKQHQEALVTISPKLQSVLAGLTATLQQGDNKMHILPYPTLADVGASGAKQTGAKQTGANEPLARIAQLLAQLETSLVNWQKGLPTALPTNNPSADSAKAVETILPILQKASNEITALITALTKQHQEALVTISPKLQSVLAGLTATLQQGDNKMHILPYPTLADVGASGAKQTGANEPLARIAQLLAQLETSLVNWQKELSTALPTNNPSADSAKAVETILPILQKASTEITALITALTKQQPKLAMQLPVNPLVSKITDRQRTDLSNPLNNTQPPVKAVAENLLLNNRVVTMSPDVRPVMDGSNAKAEIATLNQQLPATTTSSTTVATSFVAKEGLTTPAQLGERLLEMVKTVFVRQQPEQTTTVRLKLYPEHLGEVIVRLTYNLKTANSRGELSVQFYVANALAKDALENALPQLRETISQQLKLNDASIFNNQDGSRWQQDKPAGLAGREQQQGEEPLPDDDLAESGVWRDNEGVVTGLDQLV